ncbi:MAG: glutathione S-transferase family protein [Alphaproteobacteria bacterium]|nr:glutathione S-transferase family protein [Alphaproteobacteria bacterium]
MTPVLHIGNRNYSSWSLRPWLCLRWAGIAFEESHVELDQPGYGEGGIAAVRAVSPSGRVPALQLGQTTIWDSLAIAEWAAEQAGPGVLWPRDPTARAVARAVTCEMHAGFEALRRDLPMNIRRRCAEQDWAPEARRDIARLDAIWSDLRSTHGRGGSFLFGARSIADAFFTPVATRMRTYSVSLSPAAQHYRDTLLADPAFREWEVAALAEWRRPFSRAPIDTLYV